jgi:hypothetical protein
MTYLIFNQTEDSLMVAKTTNRYMGSSEIVKYCTLIWSTWGDAIFRNIYRILWTRHPQNNYLELINTHYIKVAIHTQKEYFVAKTVTITLRPAQFLCTCITDYCLQEGEHMSSQQNRSQQSFFFSQPPSGIFWCHLLEHNNGSHSHCNTGPFKSILITRKNN